MSLQRPRLVKTGNRLIVTNLYIFEHIVSIPFAEENVKQRFLQIMGIGHDEGKFFRAAWYERDRTGFFVQVGGRKFPGWRGFPEDWLSQCYVILEFDLEQKLRKAFAVLIFFAIFQPFIL